MATGDIQSVRILGPDDYSGLFNGWAVEIGIECLSTGGTYALGLDADYLPTSAKLALSMAQSTFDADGDFVAAASATETETLYGTKQCRKPYPNEAVMYETAATTDPDGYNGVKIIIGLSDYVYVGDLVDSVAILAGLYTQGGNPSNAYSSTATNSSTLVCPKCIANWSWPGYIRWTGDVTVRAVGFHISAKDGKPLRGMLFTLEDGSAHTVTKWVTTPTVDSGMADENAVIEYVATFTASELATASFVDGAITADFKAVPFRSDSSQNGPLDTSDAVNSGLTWKYTSQSHYYDSADAFGVTVAFVDSATADDSTGAAGDIADAATLRTTPYKTISGAVNAIKAFNNTTYTRATVEAGIIYLESGSHAWTGATNTPGTTALTWLTICPASGVSDAVIDSQANDKDCGALVNIKDLTITFPSTVSFFDGSGRLWFDNCVLNNKTGATTACIYGSTCCTYFTHSEIYGKTIALGYSTRVTYPSLIRGCVLGGAVDQTSQSSMLIACVLGNTISGLTSSTGLFSEGAGAAQFGVDGGIFAFNDVHKSPTRFTVFHHTISGTYTPYTHGYAMVQNVLEGVPYASSEPIAQLSGDSAIGQSNNMINWHNTIVGERLNACYQDVGTAYVDKRFWEFIGMACDDYNIKTDTFGTADAARTGNWTNVWGVGFNGNVYGNTPSVGAPNAFENEAAGGFGGISQLIGDSEAGADFDFDNYQAGYGETGDGDYHIGASSECIGRVTNPVLPYDLDGNTRSTTATAAGAYYSSTEAAAFKPYWARHCNNLAGVA